jgi:hypothetical protein
MMYCLDKQFTDAAYEVPWFVVQNGERCPECHAAIDEDKGCVDSDCLEERRTHGVAVATGHVSPFSGATGYAVARAPENDSEGDSSANDDAIASDIDAALVSFAAQLARVHHDAMLNLLREIEQKVQEIHRSNSVSTRDEMLVALKGLLNAEIIKELSR